MTDFLAPARFGRYEVARSGDGKLDELGRGAMGTTYRARDTLLHRDVVLKVVNQDLLADKDGVARRRFLREAAAAAQVISPHAAAVHDIGQHDGTDYYVMEFVEGESLAECIKREGPLVPTEALLVARHVALALGAAWKHQLIHRDIKPANLMLTAPPETVEGQTGRWVKLIDFGLAKSVVEQGGTASLVSAPGAFLGTPAFASPEQLEGRPIDTRSDLYSLGVTLFFALAGELPFGGTTLGQVITAHLMKPPPLEKLREHGVPEALVQLVARLLEKDPDLRPADGDALLHEIDHVQRKIFGSSFGMPLAAVAVPPPPVAPPPPTPNLPPAPKPAPPAPPPPPRRRGGPSLPLAPIIGVAGLAAVLIGLAVYDSRSTGVVDPPAKGTPAPTVAPTSNPTPRPNVTPVPLPKGTEMGRDLAPVNAAREALQRAPQDVDAAMATLRSAAEQGDVKAMSLLGASHFYGWMCEPDRTGVRLRSGRDYAAAKPWIEAAAARGDERASVLRAQMLLGGLGMKADPGEAIQLAQDGADKGWPLAQTLLGLIYAQGPPLVIAKNPAKARQSMEQAAVSGFTSAESILGFWYLLAENVPLDPGRGMTMLRGAEKKGSVTALFYLGLAHSKGLGVARDEDKAILYLRQAARAGYDAAQDELRQRNVRW